jgi:hypothetical protein
MTMEAVPPDLAARLNVARHRVSLTVGDVAERCDISPDRLPTETIARRLIDVLELDDPTADLLILYSDGRYVSSGGFGVVAAGG